MIFMTLVYITYLGYSQFHDTWQSKTLEIANESIFILIQYMFVLLNNLVSDFRIRELLGYVIIGLTSTLILLNILVIGIVSLKP